MRHGAVAQARAGPAEIEESSGARLRCAPLVTQCGEVHAPDIINYSTLTIINYSIINY